MYICRADLQKAQEALDHASEAAVMLGHSYIGSEHLLISTYTDKKNVLLRLYLLNMMLQMKNNKSCIPAYST